MGGYLFYIWYFFCHISTWTCHRCTCVPHPVPPSHLPLHPLPLGHPSAPAPSTLYHASNQDWGGLCVSGGVRRSRTKPSSLLSPHTIPLGHPSAPAPSTLYHALNLDWRFISHIIIDMFQCHSPKSSHPHPLPQSPKDCSIHLCPFCYLTYRVIVTIFLKST